MKNILYIIVIAFSLFSCKNNESKNEVITSKTLVYVWDSFSKESTDENLKTHFEDLKNKGVVFAYLLLEE